MTLARLALLISLLALLGAAGAVEIEILEADRLEQRRGPGDTAGSGLIVRSHEFLRDWRVVAGVGECR